MAAASHTHTHTVLSCDVRLHCIISDILSNLFFNVTEMESTVYCKLVSLVSMHLLTYLLHGAESFLRS